MKDATLVYTANDHPTAVRLNRLRKQRGWKYLHRNADEWEGSLVRDCKAVVIESRDFPVFDYRVALEPGEQAPEGSVPEDDNPRVVLVRKTLADAYEEIGVPVRVLKRRGKLAPQVIDIDAEDRIESAKKEYLSSGRPPSAEGKRQLRDKKAKAAKRKL